MFSKLFFSSSSSFKPFFSKNSLSTLKGAGSSISTISISKSAINSLSDFIDFEISRPNLSLSPFFNFLLNNLDPKSGRICNSEIITIGKFFCDFKKSGTVSFSDDKFKITLSVFLISLEFVIGVYFF